MAKPSGAMAPTDYGYDAQVGAGNWSYAYVCFRLPFMPKHWQDEIYSSDRRHTCQPSFQYYIAGACQLKNTWSWFGDPSGEELPADTVTAGAGWDVRSSSQPLTGLPCSAPPLGTSSTLPRYTCCEIAFQEPTSGGATTEMIGVYVELLDSYTYTEPAPAGELSAELTDRATVRLYAADQPASAWHAQWLLAHTLNKAEYEARQCWSVPV